MSGSAGSAEVYIGRWTDYSYPYPFGDTITLRTAEANLLIAATSLFVTIAGIRLWTIIAFALHQWRSKPGVKDGLFRQQQVVLRNSTGPFGTFLSLAQLGWAWRSTTHGSRVSSLKRRTLMLSVPALLYALVFTVLGILASRVARGENVRLVNGICGGYNANEGAIGFTERFLNNMQSARAYAQQCYLNRDNSPGCNFYPVGTLPYSVRESDCPFGNDNNGNSLCLVPPIQLDTEMLNSDTHFGINARPEDRVNFQKRATCAPLNVTDYTRTFQDGIIERLYLGPIGDIEATHFYNATLWTMGVGLQLTTVSKRIEGGEAGGYEPIVPLNVTDANLGLVFLMQNSVTWRNPVLDPWYRSTFEMDLNENTLGYSSDNWTTVMGCTDQVRFCNPSNSRCSDFQDPLYIDPESLRDSLELNQPQTATVFKFSIAGPYTLIAWAPQTLNVNSLLGANGIINTLIGNRIPENQWEIDVEFWYQASLSLIQADFIRFATEIPDLSERSNSTFDIWAADGALNGSSPLHQAVIEQCSQTRVRSGQNHQNFSFLGLMLILLLGLLIILVSYSLEPLIEMKRKHWRMKRGYREVARIQERLLNLFALAYHGFEGWEGLDTGIPVAPPGVGFRPLMEFEHGRGYEMSSSGSEKIHVLPTQSYGTGGLTEYTGLRADYSGLTSPQTPYVYNPR